MKKLALVLLGAWLVAGVAVTDALAQAAPAPSESAPSSPAPSREPAAPGAGAPGGSGRTPDINVRGQVDRKPDVNVDSRTDIRSGRDDGAAASPRTTEGNRIFGMSPTMAVILAAALLVVVILAIVGMSRSGGADTHVDVDRRL